MKAIFMPGCGVNREYKEEVAKTVEYLEKHFDEVILHQVCCKMEAERPTADVFIYSCFGCYPRMLVKEMAKEHYSIYEIFEQYGLPVEPKESNKNITLGVHECSKLKEDQINKDLLRSTLTKLGYNIEDEQIISDDYDKCGKVTVLNDKENGLNVLEHSLRNYKSDTIVSVCKGCVAHMNKTNRNATHLFEQIFK